MSYLDTAFERLKAVLDEGSTSGGIDPPLVSIVEMEEAREGLPLAIVWLTEKRGTGMSTYTHEADVYIQAEIEEGTLDRAKRKLRQFGESIETYLIDNWQMPGGMWEIKYMRFGAENTDNQREPSIYAVQIGITLKYRETV